MIAIFIEAQRCVALQVSVHTTVHKQLSNSPIGVVLHQVLTQHRCRDWVLLDYRHFKERFQLWKQLAVVVTELPFVDNIRSLVCATETYILNVCPWHKVARIAAKQHETSECRAVVCQVKHTESRQLFLYRTSFRCKHLRAYSFRNKPVVERFDIQIIECCGKARRSIKCRHKGSTAFKQNALFRLTRNVTTRTDAYKCPSSVSHRWYQ